MIQNPNRNSILFEKRSHIEHMIGTIARRLGSGSREWKENDFGSAKMEWNYEYRSLGSYFGPFGFHLLDRSLPPREQQLACYFGTTVYDSYTNLYIPGDWEPVLERLYSRAEKTMTPVVVPVKIEICGGMRKA